MADTRSVPGPSFPSVRQPWAIIPWAVAVAGVVIGVIGWITRPTADTQRSRFVLTLPDTLAIAVGPGP